MQRSLPPLTSLLFTAMVKVTHVPLLPRALREGQTRREAGAQSLWASKRGGRAAEQSGRAFFEALPRGKEGDDALSYHSQHSIICEVSGRYTQWFAVLNASNGGTGG